MGDFDGHPFRGNQYTTGRFSDYDEARRNAGGVAKRSNMDVAIRATKEYGKLGFNVGYASKNDSDYARAEIVKPTDPEWTRGAKVSVGKPPYGAALRPGVVGPDGQVVRESLAEVKTRWEQEHGPTPRPGVPAPKYDVRGQVTNLGEMEQAARARKDSGPTPRPGVTVSRGDFKLPKKYEVDVLVNQYNKATAPNVLRTDHEYKRNQTLARATLSKLRRLGGYSADENGKLRVGRRIGK